MEDRNHFCHSSGNSASHYLWTDLLFPMYSVSLHRVNAKPQVQQMLVQTFISLLLIKVEVVLLLRAAPTCNSYRKWADRKRQPHSASLQLVSPQQLISV